MTPLAAIPVVNICDGGPVRRAAEAPDRARSLRDECIAWLPRPAAAALPAMDALTRRWLRRSASPYVAEVDAIAAALNYPGIWFLNGCYQWGCTTLACERDGAPWLARTLDWPFHGLGRHLEVARMRGPAGIYDNVCWPGYVGVLTASAPGRFAATINQAPLRRRTRHPWLRPLDMALNALRTWRICFIPPDHLLRSVFETCRDYGAARHRLETTPIARPAIFTLAGCAGGECCVIERTEQGFATRTGDVSAANDWLEPRAEWEARTRADLLLSRTYEETAASSRTRRESLAEWREPFAGRFDWVVPPVLNPYTRLAVEMCPAKGVLHAAGLENVPGAEFPQVVAATPAANERAFSNV